MKPDQFETKPKQLKAKPMTQPLVMDVVGGSVACAIASSDSYNEQLNEALLLVEVLKLYQAGLPEVTQAAFNFGRLFELVIRDVLRIVLQGVWPAFVLILMLPVRFYPVTKCGNFHVTR